jgi:hypothetical protein
VASGKKTGGESPPHSITVLGPKSVLRELALEAVRLGADTIEVEFNYGHEEVVFLKDGSRVRHHLRQFERSSKVAA